VTNHLPSAVLTQPDSVGKAIAGVEVTIRAPDGTALPAGAEGEVVVSSAAVARSYLLGAPDGSSPFRQGTFWMGDIGTLTQDGFLTIHGRQDAIINVGGLKVSPVEIAVVLEAHPAVVEAGALGVPDGRGECLPCAMVVPRSAVDEQELLKWCRASLAEYKV